MISRLARGLRAALVASAFGAVLAVGPAAPSSATAPIDVAGPVTDPDRVLGGRADEVRDALDEHLDRTGYQLFVVFVPDFDGQDGRSWADDAAEVSRLGDEDVLLAVATQERAYGLSVPDDLPLSDGEVDGVVDDDLLPALREGDWAGAAIATAQGLADAEEAGGISWPVVGGVGAAGLGIAGATGAVVLVRRRRTAAAARADLERLERDCGVALVAADGALQASAQELSFAEAQFGTQATLTFQATLQESRALVARAFELRQHLDDDVPETPADRGRIATEILSLCAEAGAALDARTEEFDALRDLHARVPDVLAALATRADELAALLPAARATLDGLMGRHPATDLVGVRADIDRAEQLVAEVRRLREEGDGAVAAEDRATAVAHAKAAEAALEQAAGLLGEVDRADADLQAAPTRLRDLTAAVHERLEQAAELAPDDTTIAAAAAQGRAAMDAAQVTGRDPLAAVEALQAADGELTRLLTPVLAAAARVEQARQALERSLVSTRDRVDQVARAIAARGLAVGPQARTRLSEASRHLAAAVAARSVDPEAALSEVTRAGHLVEEAGRLARPVLVDDGGGSWGGGWGGGGWSSGSLSRRSRSSSRGSSSRRSSSRSGSRRSGGSRGGRSRGGRF